MSFTVTNTGTSEGAEIAQLYVGKEESGLVRPKKELKGFAKVWLKPGESKEVEIPFDDKTFRYFNTKTNQWEIEGGTNTIMVGASSADIRLSDKVKREGTTDVLPEEKVGPLFIN